MSKEDIEELAQMVEEIIAGVQKRLRSAVKKKGENHIAMELEKLLAYYSGQLAALNFIAGKTTEFPGAPPRYDP
jgi:hypothetical protein